MFTVKLAIGRNYGADNVDPDRWYSWNAVLDADVGRIVINLDFSSLTYKLTSPCCRTWLIPSDRICCYYCPAAYDLPIEPLEQNDVLDGVRAYGARCGWWADEPLTSTIEASALLDKMNVLGREASGRRSIYHPSAENRARVIEAGFAMLQPELGWAPDHVRLKFNSAMSEIHEQPLTRADGRDTIRL